MDFGGRVVGDVVEFDGRKFVYCADPDGHLVELIEARIELKDAHSI
jgi:hypothetical protein